MAAPVVVASPASADNTVCDSCASCTEKLAIPNARVLLGNNVTYPANEACIVIRGSGAQFDGLEHEIRSSAGGAAVRVEAPDVLVKNLHTEEGAVGVDVYSAPRFTLFHAWIQGAATGVRVAASAGVRITRSVVSGKACGISFGASDGTCRNGLAVQSPGAVIANTRVQGSDVGIAACDTVPTLVRNEVVNNGVGILFGAPSPGSASEPGQSRAFDACLCAPPLAGVKPGTTLLFSSGCGGCQVHEGWLPELRKQHHDIVVREAGVGNADAMARFDAFMDRCAPEVTDVIGIPGCVPNYTCLANGTTFKTRRGDREINQEAGVSSPEDVAKFAIACNDAAEASTRGGTDCVKVAMRDNVLCLNRDLDVRSFTGPTKLDGQGNACTRTEGFSDGGSKGCDRPCPADLPARPMPSARASREPSGSTAPVQPSASAASSSVPPATPTASTEPATAKSPEAPPGLTRWIVGLGGVALASIVLGMMVRGSRKR